MAVYDADPSDPNYGHLLKQVIPGGLAYDNPVEVTIVSPADPNSLQRLHPVCDEAGDDTLQVVLNADGELVSRNVPNNPSERTSLTWQARRWIVWMCRRARTARGTSLRSM